MVYLISLIYLNPYRNNAQRLIEDHSNTLKFGAYVEIFDLSTSTQVDRLFIIRPENVILYNYNGSLFYYLDSSNVFCPREFSLVRFNKSEIRSINETGLFNTVCTNVNSLVILEHFITLKNNISDENIILTVDEIEFSILDIINLLIYRGYVQLND
jgi:Baculovirus 19 kDa protein conserved region